MKICIDAGHGGIDPGAVGTTPFRLDEKTITLALAAHLEEALETRGHWVVLTRRHDRTLPLADRAAYANQRGAELFISLHLNAATDPTAEGIEVFHFPGSAAGQQFGEQVLAALATAFPDHRNRGLKSAQFVVLRDTAMPAILVECEFISNPQQLRFLANPAHWDLLAQAIANGLEPQLAVV
jgi:N-acetylmuramoyl-L-alanine amidase